MARRKPLCYDVTQFSAYLISGAVTHFMFTITTACVRMKATFCPSDLVLIAI